MSDDFLRDLEGQLQAAAERRAHAPWWRRAVAGAPRAAGDRPWAPRAAGDRPWAPRLAGAALIAAVVAIGVGIAVSAGPGAERDATPAGRGAAGEDGGSTAYAPPATDCGSTALWEAAPALALPPEPRAPAAVQRGADDSPLVERDLARRVLHEDGVAYWVVPHLACADRNIETDEVCMVPVLDEWDPDEPGAPRVCSIPEDLDEDGMWMAFPVQGDDRAIAGIAPPGADTAVIELDGREVTRLDVIEGAYGGIVERDRPGSPPDYTVAYEGVVRETRPIAVFGADAPGVAKLLRDEGFGAATEAGPDAGPPQPGARVYFSGNESVRELGVRVLEAMGLKGEPLPVPDSVRAEAPDAVVWVVLGAS